MARKIELPKIKNGLIKENIYLALDNDDALMNHFENQEISKKIIVGMEFDECIFTRMKTDFDGVIFKSVRFIDVIFDSCDFSNASFELCHFTRCKFINCKLLGVSVYNSSLTNISFNGVLSYINFANNKFKRVEFNECNLEEGRFLENNINLLYFESCNLNRIEFIKCDLAGIDLTSDSFDDLRISPTELKGIIMNSYQACIIARKLGIIIEG